MVATCAFTGFVHSSRPDAPMSPETSVVSTLVACGVVYAFLQWRDRPSRPEDDPEDDDQYGLGLWKPEPEHSPADDESLESRQVAGAIFVFGLILLAINHAFVMSTGYKYLKLVLFGGILSVYGAAGLLEPWVLAVALSARERVHPPWAVRAFALSVAGGFGLVWALYFWLY